MRLYLANKYGNLQETKEAADVLREDGHLITSSWHDGGEEGLIFPDIAERDLLEVLSAEAVVKFTQPYGTSHSGGGRHTEFGVALGSDRHQVFIIGPREQIFDWHPKVVDFPTLALFRRYMKATRVENINVPSYIEDYDRRTSHA
jgi:hypothetical protein